MYARLLILVAISFQLFAADPFAGKWKLNRAKSTFSPKPFVTYDPIDNGWKITWSTLPKPYIAKFDGSEYPVPQPAIIDTISLRRIDARTVEQTSKKNGQIVNTQTLRISTAGSELTTDVKGVYPGGQAYHNTAISDRVGGAADSKDPFIGKWEANPAKSKYEANIFYEFEPIDGGYNVHFSTSTPFKVKLDGQEYPSSEGVTVSMKRLDDGAIHATYRRDGKVSRNVVFAVSRDGNTLTERSSNTDPNRPLKIVNVYERQ